MKERLLKLNYAEYKEDEPVSLYDANGTWICDVGDCVEFAWIRIQIMRQQVAGCYIVFHGEKYEIGTNGRINNWPKGLFDKHAFYLATIGCGYEAAMHYQEQLDK